MKPTKPARPKPALSWGVFDITGKLITTWHRRGEGAKGWRWVRVRVVPVRKKRKA